MGNYEMDFNNPNKQFQKWMVAYSTQQKLTGRYGNKGVITSIISDENMPTTESGETAEVCLNLAGVMNRLNCAQLFEQLINHMSEKLLKENKDKDTMTKYMAIVEYIGALNKQQADYITKNVTDIDQFVEDCYDHGIYIHEPPFFGNTTLDALGVLMKNHPTLMEPEAFKGISRKLIMGDLYFIKLKHSSDNKASYRSTSSTNIKNLPSKSLDKKNGKSLILNSAIRLGNMETTYLQLSRESESVDKLLRMTSTSEEDRAKLVETLLTAKNPMNANIDVSNTTTINRRILDAYLHVLGIKLVDTDAPLSENIAIDEIKAAKLYNEHEFDGLFDDDLDLDLDLEIDDDDLNI